MREVARLAGPRLVTLLQGPFLRAEVRPGEDQDNANIDNARKLASEVLGYHIDTAYVIASNQRSSEKKEEVSTADYLKTVTRYLAKIYCELYGKGTEFDDDLFTELAKDPAEASGGGASAP